MKHIVTFFFSLFILKANSQLLMFKNETLPYPKILDKSVVQWNKNQINSAQLSTKEQQFYYWVNYSRINPKRFFDSVIIPVTDVYTQLKGNNLKSLALDLEKSTSLPLFVLNDTLIKMAAYHANDITSHNANPSHTSTNGDAFSQRFKKFNQKNCGGENISYGSGDTDPLLMLILLYLDINVPDLGHRKALLNASFINTGVSSSFFKNGNIFLVEDFSCNQN